MHDGRPSVRKVTAALKGIPGMIPARRCELHYLLAVTQPIDGDIVEVGSWQGRNTCYLAAACRDSGNGIVHAIDHFKGNPGKEQYYMVKGVDDLEAGFRANVAAAGLDAWVELHNVDVASVEIDGPVRMLIVDGEHSYDAVKRDLALFTGKVPSGGLVIFDDYSPEFPGVVEAVNEWADGGVQIDNSLIVTV